MLEMNFHLFNDLSELLPEDVAKKGSSHIKSFLTVVISVIFNSPTKVCLNKPISHVTNKESLLERIAILNTDMGKKIIPQKLFCVLDTVLQSSPISSATVNLS